MRSPVKFTRRRCKISKEGLELLASLDRPIDRVDDAFDGALSEQELKTLIGYLDRLRAKLRELED